MCSGNAQPISTSEEFLGVSWWCPISPGWFDICGWPVEDIWVTYGNLAKDQWTHWVNIGDPMNGLKNPWFFSGFSCWCLIIPGCSDICGWPVENIWVTYGNLAKDQWAPEWTLVTQCMVWRIPGCFLVMPNYSWVFWHMWVTCGRHMGNLW